MQGNAGIDLATTCPKKGEEWAVKENIKECDKREEWKDNGDKRVENDEGNVDGIEWSVKL